METRSLCLRLLACSLTALAGCSSGSLSSHAGLTGAHTTELRQLPVESKFYFRRPVLIPARTGDVVLPASPEVPDVQLSLKIDKAEVDRTIGPGTPLLLDSILRTETGAAPSCTTTLSLVTSSGQSLRLRASRRSMARTCAPVTIADLSDLLIVVPKPPVPIR
jgi:hypothetical protein